MTYAANFAGSDEHSGAWENGEERQPKKNQQNPFLRNRIEDEGEKIKNELEKKNPTNLIKKLLARGNNNQGNKEIEKRFD
ncbi:unnamed protein product [Dovyalis caffra]|uniref:Uncharacterized protein n=1 Tax=Dovyalis caffra TaxID=77055 RepID=A0AAV1SP35_9ROSI|nr:unnamed protein product [Dovyalis caffra]